MSYLRFLCVALLFFVVCGATLPADKCFTQTRECCFKYKQCGYEIKTVRKIVPCPFKKCEKVCKPQCSAASSIRPVEKCEKDKYGKKVCKTVFVTERTESCKKVCEDKCTIVPGTCVQTQTIKFYKFCANLSCGPFKGDDAKKPPVVTDKKPTIMKTDMGKATMKK